MSHTKHPKCECGNPLFKSFRKGRRVPVSAPYRYCRNKKCIMSGAKGIGEDMKPPVRSAKRRAQFSDQKQPVQLPTESTEPPHVAGPRRSLEGVVRKMAQGQPKEGIALVLALICQIVDEHEAANGLISKHNLENLGLKSQKLASEKSS